MVQLYHKMSILEQTSAIVGIFTLCKMMLSHFRDISFAHIFTHPFVQIPEYLVKEFCDTIFGTEVNIKHEH